jgi:hypothetical protein
VATHLRRMIEVAPARSPARLRPDERAGSPPDRRDTAS